MHRDPGLAAAPGTCWAVGEGCTLDLARAELVGADGRPVELRAQALRVLLVLGEHAGEVVGKDELMQRVWGDIVVTEDSLVQAVGDIRRALGDQGHRQVRTVPRRGYVLVAEAVPCAAPAAADSGHAAPAALAAPTTRPSSPARRWAVALGTAVLVVVIGVAAWAAAALWRNEAAAASSLAVLPFEGVEGTEGWFVDGVASDLTTILSSWNKVKVIGRGTMLTYRGRNADPRTVGAELGVRYVLSGNVRRDGDQVRIAVSLVDARDGQIVWSDLRDVPRAELPALVGDVAGGIARTLAIGFGDAVAADGRSLKPHEVKADDLALQGMAELLRNVSRESWESARQTFEAAVALDPTCLRCLGGLSLANSNLVLWEWAADRNAAIARAEQALAQLSQLAPDRSITRMAAASLAHIRRDYAGALAIGDWLAEHYPNEPTSHHHRCSALLRLGRFEESIAACERAQRISPRDSRVSVWQGLIGFNQFQLGRYALAEQATRASVLANPRVPFYSVVLAAALAEQGRRDEAAAGLRDAATRHPDYSVSRLTAYWVASDARFLAGRDRVAAWAAELGLPP